MSLRRRWLPIIAPACLVVTALSWGTVGAADKTKVDQATEQVEQGAKRVGQGKVGPGLKEMFTGVGHTIVEGAKFSGNTMAEFFKKTFSRLVKLVPDDHTPSRRPIPDTAVVDR